MNRWLNMLRHIGDVEEVKLFTYKGESIYSLLSAYKFLWENDMPIKPNPQKEKRFREILSKLISIKRYWEKYPKQNGMSGWEIFLKFVKNGGDREIEKIYDDILKEKFIRAIEKRFQADYPIVKLKNKEYIVHFTWNDEKQKWEAFLTSMEGRKIIEKRPLGEFLQILANLK